jgi:catalase
MATALLARGAALALIGVAAAAIPGPARAEADAEALVNALNAIFGKHPHMRAAHAKGICVKGDFKPTAEAAGLSKSPQFAKPVAIVGRFSLGGGNPASPDNEKGNVRGFAIHFDIGGGNTTDLVTISAPIFPAKTPDGFLSILQTLAPGPDGKPDKDKIGAFFKAHPEFTGQNAWLTARPMPAGFASAGYWGVHTFTLTSASGGKQIIKWKLTPAGGEKGLSDEEAKAKGADFYIPELKDSLAKGPAGFDLEAYLGEPGDATDDPTVLWPFDARKNVKMGTLSIAAVEPDATCDAGMFDPGNLADGVSGPEKDEIFPMRTQAYAVSLSRRAE